MLICLYNVYKKPVSQTSYLSDNKSVIGFVLLKQNSRRLNDGQYFVESPVHILVKIEKKD